MQRHRPALDQRDVAPPHHRVGVLHHDFDVLVLAAEGALDRLLHIRRHAVRRHREDGTRLGVRGTQPPERPQQHREVPPKLIRT